MCALGEKLGFLHSKSECWDPVLYTGMIPVKTGWLVGMTSSLSHGHTYSHTHNTHTHSFTTVVISVVDLGERELKGP